ncbi:hypothetical protein PCANC_01806 [Puccinia coronata f. sp. avenae]|uniref:Uncharacterized protein n=1 Tax=Puccinia coronata f. sp. avenae TaxID=200324 RepID=A0A2N5W545_9BASI|nr:hypothetical protein PCANC_01806 [Puccinia coronata f. sp. avenae]
MRKASLLPSWDTSSVKAGLRLTEDWRIELIKFGKPAVSYLGLGGAVALSSDASAAGLTDREKGVVIAFHT